MKGARATQLELGACARSSELRAARVQLKKLEQRLQRIEKQIAARARRVAARGAARCAALRAEIDKLQAALLGQLTFRFDAAPSSSSTSTPAPWSASLSTAIATGAVELGGAEELEQLVDQVDAAPSSSSSPTLARRSSSCSSTTCARDAQENIDAPTAPGVAA